MDSRTREKPERTFDLVIKVECPSSENEDPVLLWKFPEDFSDQDLLCMVPKFCFPFAIERVTQSQIGQHFTFVLTDIESKQRFGFCRLTSGGKICLCILSYLPWFEIYYKLLNTLADYLVKEQENDLNDMLKSWYNHPVPEAHTPVSLSLHSYFITPDVTGLPTIPESRNLTEYFVAVDVNNMLQIYASMLHERRIIFTSRKLSTLTACVHASASLLYPMYWQHIYIPVLPPHLLDYCCAPMPYLIGVHLSLMERVKSRSLDDVVILNVDNNSLETPFNDLCLLPSDVVATLKSKLKKQSTSTGDGVSRAFLRAQASLFGSYRDALRYKPGEPVTFCEESFVCHRSNTMKLFLETAVNLQLFKQFIDSRLEKLNSGRGFTDLFEEEITSGNSSSYQQWVHTMKKGGSLINTAVIKASPAMKSAYKFAKNQAKQGIKEVKSKLKHKDIEEEDSEYNLQCTHSNTFPLNHSHRQSGQRRKLSQTRTNRPLTHLGNHSSVQEDADLGDSASKLSSEDSEEASGYFDDSDTSYDDVSLSSRPGGEMDLLGEILDSLSTHSSDPGAGRLTAAKSLDFFRSAEDLDYKVLNKTCPPTETNPSPMCLDSRNEWNLGQDDSVLYRKHLPPSPRKRSQDEQTCQGNDRRKSEFPTIILTDTTAAGNTVRPTSLLYTWNMGSEGRASNNFRENSQRSSTMQVPWEKEEVDMLSPQSTDNPP
ncbi:DENN domain-containing protein 1B isoform X2 [Xenopus tropicalis]|uniref:DENN domain-containing protein 1B isoform X2 n=1 Tax=Xenopus tropicalis TaxID=8364 RepID=A0A6I8QGZ9_XENTR|nr:DENN domain-containing protein 1B isoform X2 [Xenopus tropicalis]|eukprot:XP_004913807.1 PREDICTED: DENN domain-containing protein 1B isoform X2 [Xenopus tropicalis]